jgi:alpha-mannosidase
VRNKVVIDQTIVRLRSLTQVSIQNRWHWREVDLTEVDLTVDRSQESAWAIAPRNARDHIAWSRGRRELWLRQRFVVPESLAGYPLEGLTLRLAVTWWAELAQIFVDGELVQEGDLFDHSARVLLRQRVEPGETIELAIRLISPGHDDGALVKSVCVYEREGTCPEPGFVADEVAIVQAYLTQFAPEQLGRLAEAMEQIDWDAIARSSAFDQSLMTLRQNLLPWSREIRERSIHLVGHAHLDLAWLWDVAETWNAAERTFKSVLQLQEEFPELTYCHTSPVLYAWIEENRPALFAAIQQQVAAGRWEVVTGLWVEPELNLVSGESLVRQVLYGQRYLQEKFGAINQVAWLPDSFGFCGQLPQILKQGGVEYFVTQKLRWNDSTQFPHEVFWWRSPDRSQILSVNSAPIGEGIDPVKMAEYAWEWEAKTGVSSSMWLPGMGDHGGGPTRDMLQVARRWQQSPFFPQMKFGTMLEFVEKLAAAELPSWDEDLYLEFHRGCYTTHADQKRRNRRCEELLYEAELFSAIATLSARATYPKAAIETAWKKVLFNQFHDILPGSAIPEVYVDADCAWNEVEQTGNQLRNEALNAIASHIHLPDPPHPNTEAIVVFNSLNWVRSQVVELPHSGCQVMDLEGRSVVQHSSKDSVTFLAEDVPAIGYRCYWICPGEKESWVSDGAISDGAISDGAVPDGAILENAFLRVTIDPKTGDLSSVFDKQQQRQILNGAGNQLQAFRDQGQYWDAWNIDPEYEKHPLPVQLVSIHSVMQNPIQTIVVIERQIGRSLFHQTYILEAHSPILKIKTTVDWQERHVLVKAAFHLDLDADDATYEIPFGAIRRTTRPESDRQKAQWEVPALRWADLADEPYGVSLLNDCKYGYDAQPNRIRLTLLRGAEWPNPESDRGHHQFTYALYPHAGSWQSARTVHHGYELNQPLQVVKLPKPGSGTLPSIGSFLTFPSDHLICTAFKQSEEQETQWIIRCYECHGEPSSIDLSASLLPLNLNGSTNLLEQPQKENNSGSPWKIVTLCLEQEAT